MFSSQTYINRRQNLKSQLKSGVILFTGNDQVSMNYPANCYRFCQDASFLYYWGLDLPGLLAVIDIDSDQEIIYGDDYTIADIIWMGPQMSVKELTKKIGVNSSHPKNRLKPFLKKTRDRKRPVHYLPQYRVENLLKIEYLTGIPHSQVNDQVSSELVQSVIHQRIRKSAGEVFEIEKALDITKDMFSLAMELIEPGKFEYEVIGRVEGLALSRNSQPACNFIFTTHGERLHGNTHTNQMEAGKMAVMDVGVESALKYTSDITRSFPVSKHFSSLQKEIYEIVLLANEAAIGMIAPGIPFRDVHLCAAKVLTEGLQQIGLMKGNLQDSVDQGAHALFFPHGIGHPLGLEIHDLESLGEDKTGYDHEFTRSRQFGLSNLRYAKRLEENMTMTVEPGIYFIPGLIRKWQGEGLCKSYIDYDRLESFIDFGGIRIEDDVLVTESGTRNLSSQIPKTISDIEKMVSS